MPESDCNLSENCYFGGSVDVRGLYICNEQQTHELNWEKEQLSGKLLLLVGGAHSNVNKIARNSS